MELERKKNNITFIDPIVENVARKLANRSLVGYTKYKTTLSNNHGDHNYWLNHLQEELMDAILYIEKLREVLTNEGNNEEKF
jgi:hypothetical protein